MNKITLFFLLIAYVTYALSYDIETLETEPYHHFNWLDEDEYSITVKFSGDSPPEKCCLWNGTNFCQGTCSGQGTVSCTFAGGSCDADKDNPATKYYYALYCHNTACGSLDKLKADPNFDDYSVDVTVAVSRESYIRYSMVLLLSLLVL